MTKIHQIPTLKKVPQALPEFERPPLIEVVCGLQFQALALQTVHLGDFWQAMRDRYPSFEDHLPLANIFDDNDRGARIEQEEILLDMPPLRRVFYVDETKNFLLQLGASKFLANWRKLRDPDAYPRFDAAYARLTEGWSKFREYAARNELGSIRLNQYELTYINHILDETSGTVPDQASELFTFFGWPDLHLELFEPSPRGIQLRFQARFKKARGSLSIALQRGARVPDGRRVFILELTARGPAAEDGADRDGWFAFAHEAIVQTFSSLTTEKAHKNWGRIR